MTDLHEVVAAVVRSALVDEAMAEGLKRHIDILKERSQRLAERARTRREIARDAMVEVDVRKIQAPDFTVSVRPGSPALVVTDERSLPSSYWRPRDPTPRSGWPSQRPEGWLTNRRSRALKSGTGAQREDQVMGFSDKQVRALARGVPARAIRSRLRAGRELSYIEGWYVVSQANRIFGFDGWDRETVETKCIMAREARGTVTAIYSARVRITVRTGDAVIVRDGHGTGEAHGDSAGEVHDRALKAAETDATKRALATFGKAFGLELYAGGRRPSRPAARDEPDRTATNPSVVTPCVRVPREPDDDTDPWRLDPSKRPRQRRVQAWPAPTRRPYPAKRRSRRNPQTAVIRP